MPKTSKQKKKMSQPARILLVFIIDLALLLGSLILWLSINARHDSSDDSAGFFDIQSVTVGGTTRYSYEDIALVSGISRGQSILSVDKEEATKRILTAFPYIREAAIRRSFNKVTITVTETEIIGAVAAGGYWMVVGNDGRGVEQLTIDSEHPPRYMYFKGVDILSDQPGEKVLDERQLNLITELRCAFSEYGLDGISVIDMTDLSVLSLSWKNQIKIVLGNDSNLTYQIRFVASSLPKLLEKYGQTVHAVYDVSAFSDHDNDQPQAVFTPDYLL